MTFARYYPAILLAFTLVTACAPPGPASSRGTTNVLPPGDPLAEAIEDAEPAERPYLTAAKPMLRALASRDYAALYDQLSSHAKAKTRTDQFVPQVDPAQQAAKTAALENLTAEQFAEWMGKMEQALSVPHSVQHVYVESIDSQVLSGQGDAMDVMLSIGQMPAEIPASIRKASIRAQIRAQLPDEFVKEVSQKLKIPEEQVRAGQWPDSDDYDGDEWPYFNVKLVLVEEAGQLKIGYFEFLPPSILD